MSPILPRVPIAYPLLISDCFRSFPLYAMLALSLPPSPYVCVCAFTFNTIMLLISTLPAPPFFAERDLTDLWV